MEDNKETNSLPQIKRLSANNDYYNIVFKKTERIASAVFYVLSFVEESKASNVHYVQLSQKAMNLHEAVINSLNLFEHDLPQGLFPLQHALIALDSTLSVATSARLFSPQVLLPVSDEIDQVLRYLRHHYAAVTSSLSSGNDNTISRTQLKEGGSRTMRRPRPQIPKNDLSSEAILVYSDITDRTARIKTVLEATPDATIKDLADIITDVSTKTIQRDLNSLIERGEVVREGERRWSKYSLKK